jgi:predicted glycoside hydrolase/deacetylase ChbG (UPF0249 family)
MKWIVVNADDLGASPGVNRGIAEAHQHGPLTSVSLMVNMPASPEGARLARNRPALSVGLHAHLTDASGRALVDFATGEGCRAVLNQQIRSFLEFMGNPPTHLDSHRNVHRNRQLLPYFLEAADRYELLLREHSSVRYFSRFYGQWGGETHLEQISVQNLMRLVDEEIPAGITEVSCHPGYPDPQLRSSYRLERQAELQTLCDPAVRAFLSAPHIHLINFRLAMDLLAGQPADDGDKGVR